MMLGRVFFDRRLLRKVWHHAAAWDTENKGHMIACSWAIEKGDWWKYRDEVKANFLGAEWRYHHDGYTRSGIYIGRLAIIYQISERKE